MHANIADRCVMKEKLYVYRCRMCREKSGENFALKKIKFDATCKKNKGEIFSALSWENFSHQI